MDENATNIYVIRYFLKDRLYKENNNKKNHKGRSNKTTEFSTLILSRT